MQYKNNNYVSFEFLSGLVVRCDGLIYWLNMIDGLARVARNRGYESRFNDSVIFFYEFRFCVLCSRVAYSSICLSRKIHGLIPMIS